jgi:hypothetical protein
MSTRTLTTTAFDGYLKLLRRPVDAMVRLLPGQRTGPAAVARVAVDRVDATVRAGLASTLRVDLSSDARRRQAAADERERALDLRRQAEKQEVRAETRVEASHRQATQRTRRAESQAAGRRRTATKKEESRTRQAAETERRRTQANRDQEKQAEEQIAAETARERLPAVEAQAEALDQRDQAATRRDEAERLGAAAARVKEERQTESNGSSTI